MLASCHLDIKLSLSKKEETPVQCTAVYSVKWADLLQWRRFRSCDAMNPLHYYNEGGHLSFSQTICFFAIYLVHSMNKQEIGKCRPAILLLVCLADFTTVFGHLTRV